MLDLLRRLPGHLFAVVDGALAPGAPLHLSDLDPRPLYLGGSGTASMMSGPHLVNCPTGHALDLVRQAIPPEAIVWWSFPGESAASAEETAFRHIRGLGMVEIPRNRPDAGARTRAGGAEGYEAVLFRHADPNVLVHLLPVMTPAQAARLLGEALAINFDATRNGGLRHAARPSDLPPAPTGLLRLELPQYNALTNARLHASHVRIAAYLAKHRLEGMEHLDEAALLDIAKRSDASGRPLGLKSEKAHSRWAYLMMMTGGQVAEDDTARDFVRSGPDPERRVRQLIDEAAAAIRRDGFASAGGAR
ncbi:DUF4123 domain-containing protein [Tropicimonas sp. IMCC34011]|uniref:DUF4123 domain-containing protein n=1 Tax=Tropicimonas sp. IMCC34011 TaxID=2248759 RepID=UPI001300A5AB|nr:DUF4123 domain-containing protein [Tropicimonas sp. IMCC34011]